MVLEVIKNINDMSLIDVGLNLIGVGLLLIALLIFISYMIDTWITTKLSFKTEFKASQRHKSADGSLGFNSFPKEIHNNEELKLEKVGK